MKKKGRTVKQKEIFAACTPFLVPRRIEDQEPESIGLHTVATLLSWCESDEERKHLQDLFVHADRGDGPAIRSLVDGAFTAIKFLRVIAQRNPDVLRPYARKADVWPDLIGKRKVSVEWNRWLLDTLEVGKESPLRGKANYKAPATQTAAFMLHWLKENRATLGLPILTQGTRKQWFEMGWDALLYVSGEHPESDSYLRQIGSHFGQHSKNIGAQEKVTPATREANIRAGIRKQVWQSFRSITRNVPLT
jgi:hypothetical protein